MTHYLESWDLRHLWSAAISLRGPWNAAPFGDGRFDPHEIALVRLQDHFLAILVGRSRMFLLCILVLILRKERKCQTKGENQKKRNTRQNSAH
jgi:hypothetical protein